jgi:hypothetical protein
VWIAIGLAPFTPWDADVVSPRYVYFAAAPFAMLMAHLAWTAVAWFQGAPRAAAGLFIAAATAVALVFGGIITLDRNGAFERDVLRYEVLGTQLPEAVPDVPPNARVVIYNGIWNRWPKWPESVLRSVYADETLTVVNVLPDRAAGMQTQPGDIVVYYADGRFSLRGPIEAGR